MPRSGRQQSEAQDALAPDLTSETAELRRIANLLALLLTRNMATDAERARTLSAAGFTNGHIAMLLEMPANTVRARLSEKPRSARGAKGRTRT